MDIDISKVMTYEIRKEMAERYFGFRKLIEEDKKALAKAIRQYSLTIEQKVCIDLTRIYVILKDRHLIARFLEISGLEEPFFYDEYVVGSLTIRARIFAGVKDGGLTRSGRFTKLLLGCYDLLVKDVDLYREKFGELLENREVINEEIEIFYRKNDIDSILGFLRSLDQRDEDKLGGPVEPGSGKVLKEKMKVLPPAPVESYLPILPPLVPMPRIRNELKKLAQLALKGHPDGFVLK